MYNKIKKQEMKEMKKNINSNEESSCDPPRLPDQRQKREHFFFIKRNCCKCGQDPYFCQCNEIIKLMYRNFNPEKNSY